MGHLKDFIVSKLREDDICEGVINDVLQLSDERIEWLNEVGCNLARVTRKYDRFVINKNLTYIEQMVLAMFETEETHKWFKEREKEHEEWLREHEKKRSSASMMYLFPVGEA